MIKFLPKDNSFIFSVSLYDKEGQPLLPGVIPAMDMNSLIKKSVPIIYVKLNYRHLFYLPFPPIG
jgi:hypothetical protein